MKSVLAGVGLAIVSLSACNLTKSSATTEAVRHDDAPKNVCPVHPRSEAAKEQGMIYHDDSGQSWRRHFLTEPQSNQRTLLLILDEPLRAGLLEKVVLRKSFAPSELPQMAKAMRDARSSSMTAVAQVATNNPIWPIDRGWTDQDEIDYGKWLQKVASVDFLVGGGVAVDCADYAITLRWIYAHDHHLPAGDQVAGSGQLFGSWQSTTEWDLLPTNPDWKKDERFKAALQQVLNTTYTHSLFTDLYPVGITPEFVSPGAIFLTIGGDSGHTRTIFSIGPNDACQQESECIAIIWGNEPADEKGYITEFVPDKVTPDGGGFLRFRWPELTPTGWQLRPALNMRGYSVEQYNFPDDDYLTTIAARLNLWTSPEDRYEVAGNAVVQLLWQRLMVTEVGYFMCSLVPCTPQDPNYADWSTPVRDKAIADGIKGFKITASEVDPNSDVISTFTQKYSHPIFAGAPISIMDILNGTASAAFNSDPSVDFFTRWGFTNLSAADKLPAMAEIIANNWMMRNTKVSKAQKLCFAKSDTVPNCDPCDPKVKSLSTARLDQAFRQMRGIFLNVFNSAPSQTQSDISQKLRSWQLDENYCSPDGRSPCSLYDYLFDSVDHWAVMTSNADSPLKSRFGF